MAVAGAEPERALAGAIGGGVFVSGDGGRGWQRLEERFGELRAV